MEEVQRVHWKGRCERGRNLDNSKTYGNDNHVTDGATTAVTAQGLGQALAGARGGGATGGRETQGVGVWGVGGAISRGRVRGVEGDVWTEEQDGLVRCDWGVNPGLDDDRRRRTHLHGPVGEEETA